MTSANIDALTQAIRMQLGDPTTFKVPTGYPDSLALCVIDSIQSTGVQYVAVVNVLSQYRTYQSAHGREPNADSASDLLHTFEEVGGSAGWADMVKNHNKTSTQRGAPLKSEAIRLVAEALVSLGVNQAEDLRRLGDAPQAYEEVRRAWTGVVGQRSATTWHYVQMLAGVPGVKPDRMIVRFIARATGLRPRDVSLGRAVELVTGAASVLEVSPNALDHAIWTYQSGLARRRS
ncbi:MAG: hypothetical protein Q7T56_20010 [Nocardioidaceae bacterium]|nr:hypothetical protein [Nocardioidaceae bacterium]